jgi:CheY-like chemotaxis protein
MVPVRRMKTAGVHGRRVLVVDDESSVSKAIQMLLEHDGHQVQTADSGEAALALLEHGKFDLIITDYSMQPMNGGQLAARIKRRWPGQPVIMATASAYGLLVSDKLSADVDFLLHKPFSLQELRDAVAQVLP